MHTFLLGFWMLFFLSTFVWRSSINFKRHGVNPLVLPSDDSTYGYVGNTFKLLIFWIFGWLIYGFFQPAQSGPLVALGFPLMLSGWLLVLVSQRDLGTSWRIGIDQHTPTALIQHGIYQRSRNPIFLGMRLALLGFWLCQPHLAVLLALVLGEVLMQIQVRLEEEHLLKMHGQTYQAYRSGTPRWWKLLP